MLRRACWLITLVAFATTFGGCSTTRSKLLADEVQSNDDLYREAGQKIAGYTLADSTHVDFRGTVRLAGPDSVEFVPESPGLANTVAAGCRKFAAADIAEIDVVHEHKGATILLATSLVFITVGIVAMATKESCPFLHSYDGKSYVFDGEPYGGAITAGLEKDDWSELEHLAEVDGQYRLLLTNEVDETQHTNRLQLAVVDHPLDSRVVVGYDGVPRALRGAGALLTAVDEAGRDIRRWIVAADHAAWSPDLAALARADSLADARHHLTLTFARPPCNTGVFLVARLATTAWGSHMIRSMLALRGNRLPDFYAELDSSAAVRAQLQQWNRHDGVYAVDVEMLAGDGWRPCGLLLSGGPFVSESRSIPLDLTPVVGDTVRLRIHPAVGYWRVDAFDLAWDEQPCRVAYPEMVSARDQRGRDLRATLYGADDDYVVFETNDDFAEAAFTVPPPVPDALRTVFAITRGWYRIHLPAVGEPDLATLSRLIGEPGFSSRWALREFAEVQQTGVLPNVRTASAAVEAP